MNVPLTLWTRQNSQQLLINWHRTLQQLFIAPAHPNLPRQISFTWACSPLHPHNTTAAKTAAAPGAPRSPGRARFPIARPDDYLRPPGSFFFCFLCILLHPPTLAPAKTGAFSPGTHPTLEFAKTNSLAHGPHPLDFAKNSPVLLQCLPNEKCPYHDSGRRPRGAASSAH
jgi:hypothetical protein